MTRYRSDVGIINGEGRETVRVYSAGEGDEPYNYPRKFTISPGNNEKVSSSSRAVIILYIYNMRALNVIFLNPKDSIYYISRLS